MRPQSAADDGLCTPCEKCQQFLLQNASDSSPKMVISERGSAGPGLLLRFLRETLQTVYNGRSHAVVQSSQKPHTEAPRGTGKAGESRPGASPCCCLARASGLHRACSPAYFVSKGLVPISASSIKTALYIFAERRPNGVF